MAGHLPIRRIGAILPTLCLVGVVVLTLLLLWLNKVGLPECALREIEALAAQNGVTLHVERIRLAPGAGPALRFDDVELSLPQENALPVRVQARKIKVEFSFGKLVSGHYLPESLAIPEASLIFPLEANTDATPLHLDELNARVTLSDDDTELRATLRGRLNNIDLTLSGRFPLPEMTGESEKEEEAAAAALPPIPADTLAQLRRMRDAIERQGWTENHMPQLELRVNLTEEKPVVICRANIPTWEQEPFHLRDIRIDADFRNNTLILNRGGFRTVEPDAEVSLQGGYDLTRREVDFRLSSTVAVLNMLQTLLDEELPEQAKLLHMAPEAAPIVELDGHAAFEEDYAVHDITLRGKITQEGMRFGSSDINHLQLSFYFSDGNLNIDTLDIALPDGSLHAEAQVHDGNGQAKLHLKAPAERLLAPAREAGLLTEEQCHIVTLGGMLELDAEADLKLPIFKPGETRLEELVPMLCGAKLRVAPQTLTYADLSLTAPVLEAVLQGSEHDAVHGRADSCDLKLRFDELVYGDETLQLQEQGAALELHLEQLSVSAEALRAAAVKLTAGLDRHEAAADGRHADADKLTLHAALQELNLPFTAGAEATIALADADFSCEASSMEEQKLRALVLTVSGLQGLRLSSDLPSALPVAGEIRLSMDALSGGADQPSLTETELSLCRTAGSDAFIMEGTARLNDRELQLRAEAKLSADGSRLYLPTAHASLPVAEFEPLLAAAGLTLPELKLPPLVEADISDASLLLSPFRAEELRVKLRIPELTRCPQMPVLKGQDITLGVESDLHITCAENGDILYKGTAHVTHETGTLDAALDGNLSTHVRITGTNTIHADVIDRLIDYPDAHFIMRDFIFTRGVTKIKASNIDTLVDYSNGITVVSHCDADVHDMDYMLMSMEDEEDADGNILSEKVRTDLGTDYPYTRAAHATCGVDVEVRMNRKDAKGEPIPDVICVDLTHPELHIDNRPWFKRQGIKGGKRETVLRGRNVKLDIENSVVILDHIEGECYPAYAIGMFYPDLQIFMKDVLLSQPAQASTAYCAFPIASDCKLPVGGTIRALAKTGAAFRFLGTEIPLEKFSGYVTISDTDVYLNGMNALTWGGVVNADVSIGFAGGKTSFDGYVQADNLNLKDIAAAYDTTLSPALCTADIRFNAPSADLDSLRAYGSFHITDGDLMEMKIFSPVGDLISDLPNYLVKFESAVSPRGEEYKPNWVLRTLGKLFSSTGNTVGYIGGEVTDTAARLPFANHLLRYDIQNAEGQFEIAKGHLITCQAKAKGYNLSVRMDLDLTLEDLSLNGNIWPKISSVPTLMLAPLTFLSDYMIDIIIYGSVSDIKWKFGLDKHTHDKHFEPSAESRSSGETKE